MTPAFAKITLTEQEFFRENKYLVRQSKLEYIFDSIKTIYIRRASILHQTFMYNDFSTNVLMNN